MIGSKHLSLFYRWANWGIEKLLDLPKFRWLVNMNRNLNFRQVCRAGLVPNCQTGVELDCTGPAAPPDQSGLSPPLESNSEPLRWRLYEGSIVSPACLVLNMVLCHLLAIWLWTNDFTTLSFSFLCCLMKIETASTPGSSWWGLRELICVLIFLSSIQLYMSSSFLPFCVFAK